MFCPQQKSPPPARQQPLVLPIGSWRAALGCAVVLLVSSVQAESPLEVEFRDKIVPILQAKCVRCHGSQQQESELDLSTLAGIRLGSESGPIVTSDDLLTSRLWEVVVEGEMPPEGEPALSETERTTLKDWLTRNHQQLAVRATTLDDHSVLPFLMLRCVACHGPQKQEGGLDVRSVDSLLKGGKSGPAIVPGKPEESLLVKRITAGEMPPKRQLVNVSVKPMEPGELELLQQWIAAGLPKSDARPDGPGVQPERLVSKEDREFWAFQTPHRPVLPDVTNPEASNPIDLFVLAGLQARGLEFNPEASRRVLIRRVYLDLLGLLPTPEAVRAFEADPAPQAYSALVERLLASPRYGERWARHWLDVAGYADSEGSQNEDRLRPHLWRYRDYVIRAFNSDKPYDRFLREQIAGDELADYAQAGDDNLEVYDNLVATGFLRTAPDRTFAGITNYVPDRLEVIADEIQILGSSVLGLTIHCARCHSHKFDPIPQRDYYRLAAALKDALDEHDWLKPAERTLPLHGHPERRIWREAEEELSRKIKEAQAAMEAEKDADKKAELEKRVKGLEGQRQPEPRIRALWARGRPSPTYLLRRGDYRKPGHLIGPGPLSVLTPESETFDAVPPQNGGESTGRRLTLANWVARPTHPLTSRVLVNRLWRHHFGRGIVTTLDNFGKMGARPTHPELLDWLAVEFVQRGFQIKDLHRLMVTSRTYRQSSAVSAASAERDLDGRWLSRMPLRRMDAEVLRDTLLQLSGELSLAQYGKPDPVEVRPDGLVTSQAGPAGRRRSVYVQHRRTQLPTLLEAFDSPQMGPNCVQRGVSIVAPQALHLMNDGLVHELAKTFAKRVRREAGPDRSAQVDLAFELALGGPPDSEQRSSMLQFLQEAESAWSDTGEEQAFGQLCHALMNSAAFIFVD